MGDTAHRRTSWPSVLGADMLALMPWRRRPPPPPPPPPEWSWVSAIVPWCFALAWLVFLNWAPRTRLSHVCPITPLHLTPPTTRMVLAEGA